MTVTSGGSQLNSTIRLHGQLGAREIGSVAIRADELAGRGASLIIIDMADVTHVDFRALGGLFRTVARAERRGIEIMAVNRSRYVRDLFRFAYPGEGESLLGAREAHPQLAQA